MSERQLDIADIGGTDFGIPGTPEADKATIEKLLPNRLQDQFCFRTQETV